MKISGSIVIYNEDEETLKKAIASFLALDFEKELIIVDNSPSNMIQNFCESFKDLRYIFNQKNVGFGTAHNLAFNNLKNKSDIHIIINPDVYFDSSINELIRWTYNNKDISICVPKVYYPNGEYQSTIRELPSVLKLFKRKLNIKSDEFTEDRLIESKEIPFAHGCFFIFQTNFFKKLDGFDESFFMYMEDVDIFIRAKKFGKTVINPKYKIYHEYRKESSRSIKLLLLHINSALKFFLKYPKLIF